MTETPLLNERYRVIRKLGTGAFAVVYLADDLQLGRQVAVKIVEHSVDVEDRVLREAQAAAKLSQPNILTVYEMVRESDRTLLFSEYIQGKTLRQRYRERSLGEGEILEVGIQMCRALAHAHKRGVVHRDVKPENIMLTDGDEIDSRLMDFGVAQLEDRASITVTGDLIGTIAYMSPEQAEGRNVDPRTDVYSLALTLYEGFVRRNPSEGKKLRELLLDASRPNIPPLSTIRPDLPQALSDVLRRAMSRDPRKRPDASAFGRLLVEVAEQMPEYATRPTRTKSRSKAEAGREDGAAAGARLRDARIPMEISRLAFTAQHLVAAGFTLCSLAYLLPRAPFYPQAAVIPLVMVPSFLALVWPFGGGVLALALMAPPIFAYGAGWGVVYLVLAALTMGLLRWRGKEWAALLPGAIPFAVVAYLGLALLPLAGALLRRWGALVGFMSGLVLVVAANLAGWATVPYTFQPSPGNDLATAEHAGSPAAVLSALGRYFESRPELAWQMMVFAVFSLPLYLWMGRTPAARMWGMSVYLILLFLALTLGPILLFDAPVRMAPLLAAYVPCAIITFLLSFLTPALRGGSL